MTVCAVARMLPKDSPLLGFVLAHLHDARFGRRRRKQLDDKFFEPWLPKVRQRAADQRTRRNRQRRQNVREVLLWYRLCRVSRALLPIVRQHLGEHAPACEGLRSARAVLGPLLITFAAPRKLHEPRCRGLLIVVAMIACARRFLWGLVAAVACAAGCVHLVYAAALVR